MLRLIDAGWHAASENAQLVAMVFLIVGILVSATAFALGVHDVEWNGVVAGERIDGFRDDVVKQVGFAWAPNWALTAIFLLPLAIYNLLAARGSVEDLINSLIESRMLVRRDGDPVDRDDILAQWQRETRVWTALSFLLFAFVVVFTLWGDFYQVVWLWLTDEDFARAKVAEVSLNDSVYEFDWSIAALFEGSRLSNGANIAFSLAAYLLIPILGAGLLLAGFVWFPAVSSFFSTTKLRRRGLVIVPDLDSRDDRAGFECFEAVFDHLIKASIFTAFIALSMHLQNVFLRAPQRETIVDMVFGNAIGSVSEAWSAKALGPILDFVDSMPTVLEMEIGATTLQSYVSGIAILLLVLIVIGLMWFWLRKTAVEGRKYLLRNGGLTEAQQDVLEDMVVWPIGWISLTVLAAMTVLAFFSMFFVNLISLFAALLFAWVLSVFREQLFGLLPRGSRRRGRRARRDRSTDDPEG